VKAVTTAPPTNIVTPHKTATIYPDTDVEKNVNPNIFDSAQSLKGTTNNKGDEY